MSVNAGTGELSVEDVFRHAVDGVFVIDRNRQVVLFSPACERITGIDKEAALQSSCVCQGTTDGRDEHGRRLEESLCPALELLDGKGAIQRMRVSLKRIDGQDASVETTYSPVYGDDGRVAYVVGIMRELVGSGRPGEPDPAGAYRPMPLDGRASTTDGAGSESAVEGDGPLDRMLTTIERREIRAALSRAGGQRTLAARLLGISRSRLYRRMEALGIDPKGTTAD